MVISSIETQCMTNDNTCNFILPDPSMMQPSGAFEDFKSTLNVTISDLGKLEEPLHRLRISTIMCFCK